MKLFPSAMAILLLAATSSFAQINFEPGYIVDNNGKRSDCLIKNSDWNNNPSRFKYKLAEGLEELEGDLKTVSAFGVPGELAYERHEVRIDMASDAVGDITTYPEFKLVPETLFLKKLESGAANLYLFRNANMKRFYFSVGDEPIRFLEYKQYVFEGNTIRENNKFKQDIFIALKCDKVNLQDVERLRYSEGSLTAFFKKYNSCFKQETAPVQTKAKRDFFNLSIRPGINFGSATVRNVAEYYEDEVALDSKLTFRMGVEAEFVLPINKNKWSIFIEPTYQYYKSETGEGSATVAIDYKSVEIPIGIRHYFFLNETARIFLNAAFEIDYPLSSKVSGGPVFNGDFAIKTGANASFGAGFSFGKMSFEVRYKTQRELMRNRVNQNAPYELFSVIAGYRLL